MSNINQFKPTLNNFNYFGYERDRDGTLLHRAASNSLNNYCEILMQNEFDCNKFNARIDRKNKTHF